MISAKNASIAGAITRDSALKKTLGWSPESIRRPVYQCLPNPESPASRSIRALEPWLVTWARWIPWCGMLLPPGCWMLGAECLNVRAHRHVAQELRRHRRQIADVDHRVRRLSLVEAPGRRGSRLQE